MSDNQKVINVIRQAIEQSTSQGAMLTLTPGVVHSASGYECSAYVRGDEFLQDITIPAGLEVGAGDYAVFGQVGNSAWLDRAVPTSLYSKMVFDFNDARITFGDGDTSPADAGNLGQYLASGGGGASAYWGTFTPQAPKTADYLTASANASLDNEIVVGASPGGELGGTWAEPTVDATHSGSNHDDIPTQTGSLNMGTNSVSGVTDLTMSGTLSAPADPTGGTHVGDRDYNDARYDYVDSGTSFPGSPSTGDKYIRTDFREGNIEFTYDGTYWLSSHEYHWDFYHSGAAVTASTSRHFPLPTDCDVYVTHWLTMRRVAATSYSMTMDLKSVDHDGTNTTLDSSIHTPTTSNYWYRWDDDVSTLLACSGADSASKEVDIRVDKLSTVYVSLGNATVYYRLRLT